MTKTTEKERVRDYPYRLTTPMLESHWDCVGIGAVLNKTSRSGFIRMLVEEYAEKQKKIINTLDNGK